MRILNASPTRFSAESHLGGGEKYVNYLQAALEFALAETRDYFQIQNSFLLVESTDVATDSLMHFLPSRNKSKQVDYESARKLIEKFDIVIVHQCLTTFGLEIAAIAKCLGKRVIGIDHGGGEDSRIRASHTSVLFFDVFVAQSRFARSGFFDLQNRVQTIFGPIQTSTYYPDFEVTKKLNTLISIGRILPHKGFESVICCMPKDSKYRIIGTVYDKEYENYLKKLADVKGVSLQILSGLSDEQVLAMIHESYLYLQPSRTIDYRGTHYPKSELLGLGALEALSCGLRVIVSDVCALSELTELYGCQKFLNESHLSILIEENLHKDYSTAESTEISNGVRKVYGHEAFGRAFISLLEELENP